ncbi:MAG: TonB-dependent receptor domain-containing protein [Bryobacteraceae bacterium]
MAVCPAWGQLTTASVSGYVLDGGGLAVNGAAVVIGDSTRSTTFRTTSDSTGLYRFTNLSPGTYRLTAEAPRFAKSTIAALPVAVDSRLKVDFHLQVEGAKETVDVTSSSIRLETETSEISAVIDRERIQKLPLNRRDFLQLALLVPGVMPPVEDSELSQRGSFAMHANGGREEFNNFLLDGIDNNDPNVNRYVLQPSVDSIQEFKISTNNFSAQYARSAGGQVNVITQRGGNEFHGFGYEYFRNRVLDARNFFDGAENPKYNRNQFGFGAGGPVIRNRLFFFGSADFLRERRGISRLGTVPGAAERSGDFSGTGRTILDPFTRQPFPNCIIPAGRISPIGQRIVALFPVPNRPGNSGNYLPQPVNRDNSSFGNIRLDYNASGRDQFSARYSHGVNNLFEPYAEDTNAIPGFGNTVHDPGDNAMVSYQRILRPTVTNVLRAGLNRFHREIVPENADKDVNRLLGVDWLPSGTRDQGYPTFDVAGYSRVGDATTIPIIRTTNTWQITDAVTWIAGRHVLNLGGEIRRSSLEGTLDYFTRGSLSFSGAISGSGLSDVLLGFPSFGLQARADNPQNLRTTAYNAYIQDDWKAAPRLTLNLGLRYEYNTPPVDPNDRMSTLDFATNKVVQVGTGNVSRSGIQPSRNNVAPRVGFAWMAGPRWVVRGGYGIAYDAGMLVVNTAQYFNPPQFNLRVFFPTATSLLTLNNPFPTTGGITPPATLNVLSPDMRSAYLQSWNTSVQRTVGGSGAFTLAYVASKGTKLIRNRNLNQPRPGAGDVQSRRSSPAFGGILLVESGANSSFQSLQATYNHNWTRSLSIWTIYTWSKSIDDASAFLGNKADKNFPQDSLNFGAERGLSSFDIPHRAVIAHTYSLPGRHWLLRHTEFRGITALQSGQPFTPILRFDNSNTGNTGGTFGSDRPNLAGDPRLDNPAPERWFNTAAFSLAPRYTFGSSGRNVVRGPSFASLDLSVARRIPVRERTEIQVEAQAFNTLNRTNFSLPELFADEPANFGRIFAARSPRQFQFTMRISF